MQPAGAYVETPTAASAGALVLSSLDKRCTAAARGCGRGSCCWEWTAEGAGACSLFASFASAQSAESKYLCSCISEDGYGLG
jgi:hypothetical protein